MGLWDFVKQIIRLLIAAWWESVTESHTQKHPPEEEYSVKHPDEYNHGYFKNGFNDYRWNPAYKTDINHLYDTYDKFKYRPAKKYNR